MLERGSEGEGYSDSFEKSKGVMTPVSRSEFTVTSGNPGMGKSLKSKTNPTSGGEYSPDKDQEDVNSDGQ